MGSKGQRSRSHNGRWEPVEFCLSSSATSAAAVTANTMAATATTAIVSVMCMCAFQAKQHELHCSIGEALVCAAVGSKSPSARDVWTVTEDDFVVSCVPCVTLRRHSLFQPCDSDLTADDIERLLQILQSLTNATLYSQPCDSDRTADNIEPLLQILQSLTNATVYSHSFYPPLSRQMLFDPSKPAYDPHCRKAGS